MTDQTAAAKPVVDEWDDAGPFIYRILPETGLDAFFTEERDMIRINREMGKWWLGEDGVMGQTPYDTIEEAKTAGDEQVAELEEGLNAMLLKEAGLDAEAWRVDLSHGISFYENDGDRWIYGDTRDGMGDGQRWEAMRGDEMVSKGHDSVAKALAAFTAPSASAA